MRIAFVRRSRLPGADTLGLLLAAFALLVALATTTASAHTYLVASSPAGGAVVAEAPQEIVLHFSEAVAIVDLRILAESDTAIPVSLQLDGKTVRLTPTFPQPPDGLYTVRWSIVGEDSHNLQGAVAFRVGDGPPPPLPASSSGADGGSDEVLVLEPSPQDASLVGSIILRTMMLFGLFVAGGATLYEALFSRPSHVPVRAAALVAIAAISGDLALKASAIGVALMPKLGPALIVLGLLAVMTRRFPAAAIGAVAAVAGVTFWGHAVLGPRLFGQPLAVLHLLVAALWIGSLWPLYHTAARDTDAAPAVRRFSRVAAPAVAALVAAGLALAWLRIGWQGVGVWNPYAVVLSLKVGLAALLIGLALWNRLYLTARLPASGAALARSIDVELVLMLGVVFAAAWLAWLPPPIG